MDTQSLLDGNLCDTGFFFQQRFHAWVSIIGVLSHNIVGSFVVSSSLLVPCSTYLEIVCDTQTGNKGNAPYARPTRTSA